MTAHGYSNDRHMAYMGLLKRAKRVNDHQLTQLLLRKINAFGASAPIIAGDGIVIPFPSTPISNPPLAPAGPMWWVLLKLTVMIPGSVTALFMLACFAHDPPKQLSYIHPSQPAASNHGAVTDAPRKIPAHWYIRNQ